MDKEISRLAAELGVAKTEGKELAGKMAAAQEASSQHNQELERLKQEHERKMSRLETEATSLSSRLATTEASLAAAQQQESTLQEAVANHRCDSEQGTERHAALEVRNAGVIEFADAKLPATTDRVSRPHNCCAGGAQDEE